MKDFVEKILLKDTIFFNGSIDQLNEKIRFKRNRKFNLKWTLPPTEFEFTSKISFGTLTNESSIKSVSDIKGYAKLTELSKNKTKIEIVTKFRNEYYLLALVSFVIIIVAILVDTVPFWVPFLIPLIFIWFWIIYRFQEKLLFNNVKKYFEYEL